MKKLLGITSQKVAPSCLGTFAHHQQPLLSFSLATTQSNLLTECTNNIQKRFGSKHIYIRGKLHYQKKLEQEKKVSKLSDKSKAAYRSNAERSQSFAWSPSTPTQELYQKNMLEFKNSRKRPSVQQFLDMLATVQSADDFNYAMRYWRSLCLRRIKFTSQSTEAILQAMEKYDENHPQTSVERKFYENNFLNDDYEHKVIKNSGTSKLAQPLTKKLFFGFITKLVNEHNDTETAITLFNEFKAGRLNLTPASEDFEFIYNLLKEKEVSKEKFVELFDKQPKSVNISCPTPILTTVFDAFQEIEGSLDVAVKKRVLNYLQTQSLGKEESIFEAVKQKLSEMASVPAEAKEE